MVIIYYRAICKIGQLSKKVSTTNIKKQFSSSAVLAARLYSDKHEWVELQGDVGTVGISNYAQEALGDVVYAQLPDKDTVIGKGEECGALESVKAASELYSPVSGTITEKNEKVEQKPALINKAPYTDGWLFKVKISDSKELTELMNETDYNEFLKNIS